MGWSLKMSRHLFNDAIDKPYMYVYIKTTKCLCLFKQDQEFHPLPFKDPHKRIKLLQQVISLYNISNNRIYDNEPLPPLSNSSYST